MSATTAASGQLTGQAHELVPEVRIPLQDRLSARAWTAVGALLMVIVLALTWFLLVEPTRQDAADLADSTAEVQTQNTLLAGRLSSLTAQAEDQSALAAQISAALAALPSATNLPELGDQLAGQATEAGVNLTSLNIGTPVAATASGTGVLSIPITLTSNGTEAALQDFLHQVQETGPRVALITSVSIGSGTASTASTGTTGATSTDTTGTDATANGAAVLNLQMTVFSNPLPQSTLTDLEQLLADASGS